MRKKTLAAIGVMALAAAFPPACAAGTHLMQPDTTSHVVLVEDYVLENSKICGTLSFYHRALFRMFPDGTLSPEPFEVPRGKNLVITDVEWAAYGGPYGTLALAPGNTLRLEIYLGPATGKPVFISRGITLDANTAAGQPGSSEQLTAGFVVGSGVPICPQATQTSPSLGALSVIAHLVLRGYLFPS